MLFPALWQGHVLNEVALGLTPAAPANLGLWGAAVGPVVSKNMSWPPQDKPFPCSFMRPEWQSAWLCWVGGHSLF